MKTRYIVLILIIIAAVVFFTIHIFTNIEKQQVNENQQNQLAMADNADTGNSVNINIQKTN